MRFQLVFEVGDRVVDAGGRTGVIVDTDYFADDNEWVSVSWDTARIDSIWSGKGLDLQPETPLPTPPAFASQAEADAWLEEYGKKR